MPTIISSKLPPDLSVEELLILLETARLVLDNPRSLQHVGRTLDVSECYLRELANRLDEFMAQEEP